MLESVNFDLLNLIHTIFKSIWFSFFVRLFFLFLFLKIADICIVNVKTHLLLKTDSLESKKQIATTIQLIQNIVNFLIVLVCVLAFLGKLGIDIKPFLATAGVAGLAVGFASKRLLEDLIEGIMIITSGQIRMGDYVEIAGKTGTVEKIDLKLITLRDANGNVHYIRNGLIDIITNYTRDYSFAFMDIAVSYDEDPDKVMAVLKDIFDKDLITNYDFKSKILDDIEIQGLDRLADSNIVIRCRIKTVPREQWAVQREFNKLILKRFKTENIEIPYPYQNVIFKNYPN